MSAPPFKKLRQTSITDSFKVTEVGMGSQQQDGDRKVWKDFNFTKPDKEDLQTIPNQDHTAESSSGDISSDAMGTACEKTASVASVSPAHDAGKLEEAAFNSLGTDSTLENSQPMSPSTSKSSPGWTSEDKKSFGTDLRHFHRMPECFNKEFPKLKHDDRHHVLINPDSILGGANRVPTVPGKKKDLWDPNHVHMPCSVENLYPVEGKNGRKEIRKRWDMIETALECLTTKSELNVFDIEDAILLYNKRYDKKWDFAMLKEYEEMLLDEQKKDFVNTIKQIALLAIKLPDVCTQVN
ncbi:poly(ADP-ribose) glycohydrolase-like isoform X1 [Lingula anatina]|uniref:Poly(ADP-ribose) glycohydrolase-like isoform X1 n=1 Tax=Lingula anatina TaxID=7574 RepID=A0A2R2MMG4_LINAN|nr:poly(ADP-ribose) glycohydrolase-like isoform X1 [Lingula anatina]|eukprot:XP_023931406.1 poly(ADP-ribose) glycohydrolase-like isoform X1 [Lingula anatina]